MNKRQVVIHPFLFALYPVATLLASNLDQISPKIGLRAAIVLVSGAALLTLIFWLWMKDIKKAGLAVSWILFSIFSFKHIVSLLEDIWWDKNLAIVTIILLIIFLILMLLGPWIIWRFTKSSPEMLTTFLNVVAIIIIIFPLFHIGRYLFTAPTTVDVFDTTKGTTIQNNNDDLPDIYYIIVDGYGRSDVIQDLYGFDNTGFLDELKENGFYIAEQSSANYMQTYLSLSSSLNYDYLDVLAESLHDELDRRDPLNYLIQQNQVRKTLEDIGYETIIYDSNWPVIDSYNGTTTSNFGQNPSEKVETLGLNGFESLLLRNTIFNYFLPDNHSYDEHRNLILNNFEGIKSSATLEGPQFIIGHVITPHPPFVFDADGAPIQPDYEYSIHDGSAFVGTNEEYITGYANQINHVNTLLLDTVDYILSQSEQPPIIIIQGDHGPGSTMDFDVLEKNTCFNERMAILNAYYFPDESYDSLYESISPVNTFRVIINYLTNSNLELAEDKSYFSLWNTPYDFVDVSDKLNSCQTSN